MKHGQVAQRQEVQLLRGKLEYRVRDRRLIVQLQYAETHAM